MNALDFALKNKACQEGIDWLIEHPRVFSMEQAWETLLEEGNRFIFWMYTRQPNISRKKILEFANHAKVNIDNPDNISSDLVKNIMMGYDNPYKGL